MTVKTIRKLRLAQSKPELV